MHILPYAYRPGRPSHPLVERRINVCRLAKLHTLHTGDRQKQTIPFCLLPTNSNAMQRGGTRPDKSPISVHEKQNDRLDQKLPGLGDQLLLDLRRTVTLVGAS